MFRATSIACGALAVAGISCQPPLEKAPETATGAPLIGRLQYQDRVVDLSVDAFADGPTGAAVDPKAYAKVIADIDQGRRGTDTDRSARQNDAPLKLSPLDATFNGGR